MSKDYRIRKFNNSAGAILCNKCGVIVKQGWDNSERAIAYHKQEGTFPDGLITQEEWDSKEPLYCKKCEKENEKTV